MTITDKQRKVFWIAAAVLALLYYAPSLLTGVHPSAATRTATVAKPAPAPSPFRSLLGNYQGRAALGRGPCMLAFQLRRDIQHAGAFVGYSTMTCTVRPTPRQWRPTPKVNAVILSGELAGDAIAFKVTDTVTAADCAPTGFSVQPFGMNQIVVRWQDKCHGGSMVLNRGN
jgi:hypothetical protein